MRRFEKQDTLIVGKVSEVENIQVNLRDTVVGFTKLNVRAREPHITTRFETMAAKLVDWSDFMMTKCDELIPENAKMHENRAYLLNLLNETDEPLQSN